MRIIVFLLALFATVPSGAGAQVRGGPVMGVHQVWTGRDSCIDVHQLAVRVAPILWFTMDEPHFKIGSTPSPLPYDSAGGTGPVVYYRALNSTARCLSMGDPHLIIEYYFYYEQDYGVGCHPNDLESARMTLSMNSVVDSQGPRYVVSLSRVEADAHGSPYYTNALDLTRPGTGDMSLPPTLLVEEGKHALAPDRNADGHYTRGYDVNVTPHDAWGIRDEFGSGYLWGALLYGSAGNKPRHGRSRLMVATNSPARDIWGTSYRADWWELPSKTYELRRLPNFRLQRLPNVQRYFVGPGPLPGCDDRTVQKMLTEKGLLADSPPPAWQVPFRELGALYTSMLQARLEAGDGSSPGAVGYSARIPFGRAFGGWWAFRSGAVFGGGPSFLGHWMLFYSPSTARPIDWYLSGGATALLLRGDVETEGRALGPAYEGGIQLRWLPRVVATIGVRTDAHRDLRMVFEVGKGF